MKITAKAVIVDCRLSGDCRRFLTEHGLKIIDMPASRRLAQPINAHPDMSLLNIGDKWFVSGEVNESFIFLKNREVTDREVGSEILEYPMDIALNSAVVGKNMICRKKYTDKKVICYAESRGYKIIDVKQGYAKCSTCIVNENSVITEDKSVADGCIKNGIDVLLLKTRAVKLNGYDYGFIGGCSGKVSDKTLLFSGCVEMHPEYSDILKFCADRGVEPVSMSKETLYDVGSIIAVYE